MVPDDVFRANLQLLLSLVKAGKVRDDVAQSLGCVLVICAYAVLRFADGTADDAIFASNGEDTLSESCLEVVAHFDNGDLYGGPIGWALVRLAIQLLLKYISDLQVDSLSIPIRLCQNVIWDD